jgi:mRNA interferase MazF
VIPVIHRGDVWWAEVPADKVRPVLVLTRERFVPRLTSLLVAPVTTSVRDIPTEVHLTKDDGLPRECAANFDNVFTLHRSRFQQRITRLTIERMQEVCRAYRFAAECG